MVELSAAARRDSGAPLLTSVRDADNLAMVLAILLAVIKGLVAWVFLMFMGTNLLGFAVGGLAGPAHAQSSDVPALGKEIAKGRAVAYVVGALSLLLLVGYLIALWRFNPGVSIGAAMLLLGRLPDLLVEMQTGKRTTAENRQRGAIYTLAAALDWLALVVMVVAFYQA